MANATTVISLGAYVSGGVASAHRNSTTILSAGVQVAGSPYASAQNIQQEPSVNLKAWLPPQRVPLVMQNGLMTWEWYRFFQYVAEVRLGGASAPTINDLSNNVIEAKTNAATANSNTAALAVQTKANADALEVTRQVVVDSNLPGADQIPPVDTDYMIVQEER